LITTTGDSASAGAATSNGGQSYEKPTPGSPTGGKG